MICTGMLISCFLLALPDFFQFFFGQIILLVNITHQPQFWGTVQDMFPSGCYLLLPSYTTILLIDKSADFAKVQLLLETVTDSTHRRFTLPDSSFTLDYEKHELHDKILLEHSIHCSFPQDDEGE